MFPITRRIYSLPCVSTVGVFNPDQLCKLDVTVCLEDVVHDVEEQSFGFELRYGVLSIMQCWGGILKQKLWNWDSALSENFSTVLAEIQDFYGKPGVISQASAYNFLRLMVLGGAGGEVNAFKNGLLSGTFLNGSGAVIGTCVPVKEEDLINFGKDSKGYWQRPRRVWDLYKEKQAIVQAILHKNSAFRQGNSYAEDHSLIISMFTAIMMEINNNIVQFLVSEFNLDVSAIVITPKGVLVDESKVNTLWLKDYMIRNGNVLIPTKSPVANYCYCHSLPPWISTPAPTLASPTSCAARFIRR